MMRTIVVGGQFGDEGKGKIIGYLALHDKPEVIAKGGVGPNAGHQIVYKGKEYSMRMLPCGFVYEKARLLIGAGVLVNPEVFLKEIEETNTKGRAFMDYRTGIILPEHIEKDNSSEISKKIGTTKTGCGPAQSDRVARIGKLAKDIPQLKEFVTDVAKEVNGAENVLIEGTQGFGISLLYGTYPYCTSKDTTASTIAADVGLGPTKIDEVAMVMKSYTTRVGAGPFVDEIDFEKARQLGYDEYGTVTRRPRRVSTSLHWDELRYAAMVNSATQIAITKIDKRFVGNAGVKKYEQLTNEAKAFIDEVEKELGIPVTLLGTGRAPEETVDMRETKL